MNEPSPALGLFLSYAHEDRLLLEELLKYLRPLRREMGPQLAFWWDRDIPPGGRWSAEIARHLEDSEVILLLISVDFLASDSCYAEMRRALELQQADKAVVVPVLLRPANWEGGPLGQLQILPRDAEPLVREEGREAAFKLLADDIGAIVKRRLASRPLTLVERSEAAAPQKDNLTAGIPRDETEAHRASWCEAAVRILGESFPYEREDAQTWQASFRLQGYCLAALRQAEALGVMPAARLPLLRKVARYLRDRAELDSARPLIEEEVSLAEQEWGCNHPELAESLNCLGVVLLDLADFEKARRCFERAYATLEQAGATQSTAAADVLTHLGQVRGEQGDWSGARDGFVKALSVYQDLPDTGMAAALCLCHLALAECELGNHRSARVFHKQALAALERESAESPFICISGLIHLARVLSALHNAKAARESCDRALSFCWAALPRPHPLTASALGNLALALKDLGHLAAALDRAEEALAIDEEVYGREHPAVAIDCYTLGLILCDLGRGGEARGLFKRAADVFAAVLGEAHPRTCAVRERLLGLERRSA